ncbi:MAG: S9 family peptidase [Bacteroidaceae bacterium]|nr:S9 family peptidase [Bacteroidaceae bacterium]
MKSPFLLCALLALSASMQAQHKTEIKEFNLAGPYRVTAPLSMDTVNVAGKAYDPASQLEAVSLAAEASTTFSGQVLPRVDGERSVGVLSFYINNRDFLKGKLEVKGPKHYKLYVDGQESQGDLKLAPNHHTLAIRYLTGPEDTDSIRVVLDAPQAVDYTLDKAHPLMVNDLTDGRWVRSISLSPDGKYTVLSCQTVEPDGKSHWDYELRDTKSGRLLRKLDYAWGWMPCTSAFLQEVTEGGKRNLYKIEPLTGVRELLTANVPEGHITLAPTEDYLILSRTEEGPKEDADIYEIVEMDDRQPSFRTRRYLARYDMASGLTQRLTFGSQSAWLMDISADGRKLLVGSSRSRLTKRPTTVTDVVVMDAQTLQTDTLLQAAEFLGEGHFSPDASQVLFTGNPEAFDRIGCVLPPEVTPSMTEYELYLFDIATKQVTPLTRDFDPSVSSLQWSVADGKVYFTAEDRDYVRLFSLDPRTGNIRTLPTSGEYVYRLSLATQSPVVAYLAESVMQPSSAYVMTLKKEKELQLFDGLITLGDARIGQCTDWNFLSSRGDTVYGRCYLPADFDPAKKYPLIVYYYGGCSPVSRNFGLAYSGHYWNSLGYVAYILQPSGATGFGQEWASRHVNTAGVGPAEDIIEGTRRFCQEHPFVDSTKIGCMGASYGGFMTMYLQTRTDLFAAAISHAGIANHTSYWGQGYWGYNYSEVSMANSYPWSHRELYVDRSPLFNADKIHTPLLLLHGDVDTNVPPIESLQMFTALKLLGREVALVQVKGQDHHIQDYTKRQKWLATQMAWFQRWLKGDSSWWDALYPKKNL